MKHKTKQTTSGTYITLHLSGEEFSVEYWTTNGVFFLANKERKEVYLARLAYWDALLGEQDELGASVTLFVPSGESTGYHILAQKASTMVCRPMVMIPYRLMTSFVKNSKLVWWQE